MVELGLLHDGIITYLPEGPDRVLVGRTFAEVAEERGMEMSTLICDLMLNNKLAVGFKQPPPEHDVWEQIDRDIMQLMQRPNYMVGSDSLIIGTHTHPRTYGSFPRFLRLQRQHGFMPLEDLINRMTAVPARRFGLADRGEIKRGKAADIVVFDPEDIGERATYEDPNQLADGVCYVLVNGRCTAANS